MDFFSNILKTTVNKAENLGKAASAAVNSFTPNGSSDERKNSSDQQSTSREGSTSVVDDLSAMAGNSSNIAANDVNSTEQQAFQDETYGEGTDTLIADDKSSFNSTEMSQKALESAKYFGNFIFNVANKAGQTVSATAKQLKNTVESVGIMQEFTKEQQEFIKEHGGKTDLMEPPWVGCEDEDKVKAEILSLSQDKRNFVRNPPAGIEFPFDMNDSYPMALALLREDPELAKMRYEIVPKLVNEETFWKNYFYRVSLIKQDPNFTTTTAGGGNNVGIGKSASWNSSKSSESEGPDDPNEQIEPAGETEFVSDTFQNSDISVDDVRQDMYKLGIHHNTNDEIDEELAKELQEFDFVSGSETVKIDDDEIQRELAEFDIK